MKPAVKKVETLGFSYLYCDNASISGGGPGAVCRKERQLLMFTGFLGQTIVTFVFSLLGVILWPSFTALGILGEYWPS